MTDDPRYGVPGRPVEPPQTAADDVRASGRLVLSSGADLAVVALWVLLWLVVPATVGQLLAGPPGLLGGLALGIVVLAVDGAIGLFRPRPLMGAWFRLFRRG